MSNSVMTHEPFGFKEAIYRKRRRIKIKRINAVFSLLSFTFFPFRYYFLSMPGQNFSLLRCVFITFISRNTRHTIIENLGGLNQDWELIS